MKSKRTKRLFVGWSIFAVAIIIIALVVDLLTLNPGRMVDSEVQRAKRVIACSENQLQYYGRIDAQIDSVEQGLVSGQALEELRQQLAFGRWTRKTVLQKSKIAKDNLAKYEARKDSLDGILVYRCYKFLNGLPKINYRDGEDLNFKKE
jgi:hypothetical protein